MTNADVLATAIAAARGAAQLYPAGHPNLEQALSDLVSAVGFVAEHGEIAATVKDGCLYVGGELAGTDGSAARSLVATLDALGIESLTLQPGFDGGDALAIVQTLAIRPQDNPDVAEELSRAGARHVRLAVLAKPGERESSEPADDEPSDVSGRSKAAYEEAAAALRDASARLEHGETVRLEGARHAAADVIGRVMDNRAAMLGLATLRASGGRDAEHGVNVMILAVATGCAMEMESADLTSLAVSALLHDIGKTVGTETSDRAIDDPATDGHPAAGAEMLAHLVADDPRPMLVAWEHHMGVDGSGWPSRPADHMPHPFSRVVAIADRYELLTSGRAASEPMTPDAAIGDILASAGTALDPAFARLFARMVGAYPPGTVVLLNDNRVAVVCQPGRDPAEPVVSVIADADGLRCAASAPVDLAGSDLRIAAVLDADLVSIDATDYL